MKKSKLMTIFTALVIAVPIFATSSFVTSVQAKPSKAGNSTAIKGGHSSKARPSTSDKHQAADAARKKQQDPQRKAYDKYRGKGGKVSFESWKKGQR